MAIENPQLIQGGTIGIEAEKDLNGTTTEVIWKIPPRIGVISVSVKLDAESGMSYAIEYTNSLVSRVDAGTAVWFDAFGANQSVSRIIPMYGAVSAVRVRRISGTMRAGIRGQ